MATTREENVGRRRSALLTALVATLCLVPVVRMVLLLRSGSETQNYDYWWILDRVLSRSGGIDLRGLFTIHEIHPLVLAGLIYWANARLGDGSNITLGYVVVALALVQVGIVAWWGFRTIDRSSGGSGDNERLLQMVFVVAAAFLLFAPAGSWNFFEAMSGVAWLPANILVLLAIWFAVRDRPAVAIALGAVASVSYGTGLLVWPVLALLMVVRSGFARAGVRRALPFVVAGGVAAAVYLALPTSGSEFLPRNAKPAISSATPRAFLAVAGFVLVDNVALATVLGVFCLVAGALLSWRIAARGGVALVWVGMWLYAVASITLMALGRTGAFETFGRRQFSRYSSLSAMLWISVIAMAMVLGVARRLVVGAVACMLVASTVAGQRYVVQQRGLRTSQDEVATAIRIGSADGSRLYLFSRFPDLTDRLRLVGHYPFDRDCGWACRRLGVVVRPGSIRPIPRREGEVLGFGSDFHLPRTVRVDAWVDLPDGAKCVAVVDRGGRVVGTGFADAPTPAAVAGTDGHNGVIALARRTQGPYRLLVSSSRSGPLLEVPRRR
jgi:hypothetical protein